jgi:hypothetical protein
MLVVRSPFRVTHTNSRLFLLPTGLITPCRFCRTHSIYRPYQPSPNSLSSPMMKLDKENYQQPHRSSLTEHEVLAAASSVVKPSNSTTDTVNMQAASPITPRPSLLHATSTTAATTKTTSSSRRSNHERTSPSRHVILTPTRMLDQGAIRIPNPHSIDKPYRRRVVKCRRRKTINGSSSSSHDASSRSIDSTSWDDGMEVDGIPDPYNTSSEQSSVYSLAMDLAMDTTPVRYSSPGHDRRDCINPVALTLWRGGQEDWHNLNHRDRSFLAARTGYYSPSWSSPLSVPSPRPVVHPDLDDATTATNRHCEISRPIPTRQVYSPPRQDFLM